MFTRCRHTRSSAIGNQRPRFRPVAEEIKTQRRCGDGSDDRGQRRNAKRERDHEPDDQHREPELPGQTERQCRPRSRRLCRPRNGGRSDTDVREDRKRSSCGRKRRVTPTNAQVIRDHDRGEPLEAVAEERQQRGRLVAGAQYVGGTRVSRAIAARVRQPEKLADDHRKRNGADQVRRDYDCKGGERGIHLQCVAVRRGGL